MQFIFIANLILRKVFRRKMKPYIPDFKTAFEHVCIHTGKTLRRGRGKKPGTGSSAPSHPTPSLQADEQSSTRSRSSLSSETPSRSPAEQRCTASATRAAPPSGERSLTLLLVSRMDLVWMIWIGYIGSAWNPRNPP